MLLKEEIIWLVLSRGEKRGENKLYTAGGVGDENKERGEIDPANIC